MQKSTTTSFGGFSPDAIRFMRALRRNNERNWFLKKKPVYEQEVLQPSRAFIDALRLPLHRLNPNLQVIPGKSMSRIYRDTRFSPDKSPYKTWIGYRFWDRRLGKEGPAYYLGWDPSGILYGAGTYDLGKMGRELFRDRITHGETATRFSRVVKDLRRQGYEIRGKDLQRIPPGYDPEHPNAEFLLHNGLYATKEEDFSRDFHSPRLVERAARTFERAAPLMDWLTEVLRAVPRI